MFTRTWNNYEDTELMQLIHRRYLELDPRGRPTIDQVRNMVVDILRLVGSGLATRDAIILLLQAGLNAALAVRQYLQHRHPRMAADIETARHPPSAGDRSTERARCTQEQDDNLPLPDEVRIIENGRNRLGTEGRAVYHYQIRKYLLERDIRKYGCYRYKLASGKIFEDQTAPHPDMLRWRFEDKKRDQLPDILLQYKKGDRQDPDYEVPDMYWRGFLVVDTDRNGLLDYRHLPSTLAGDVEGGLLEALERLDGRVRHQDLAARHYVPNPITQPDLKDLKNRDNKLAQRMRRWRESWCCISWAGKRSGSDVFMNYIDTLLPQELKDKNTTRGFRKLYDDEVAQVKAANEGKFPNRSANKDPAKRQAYLEQEAKRRQKIQEMAEQKRAEEAKQGSSESDADDESDLEQWYASEDEEEDNGEPDARGFCPVNVEEEQELHDAMLPTILHFLDLTGELPVVRDWSINFVTIHFNLHLQLRRVLRIPEGEEPPALVGYGRWTGGISYWRSASLELYPTRL
ncbi:MAG: hypothetical protein L6R39_005064 [Caloplaca ligustica]|nr:MAG: hypothetical protein L6R39_005064 [Caloplaca ligustica]